MSGEGWSCFPQLPSGFVDPATALTLKWLRPRPTPAGFGLTPADVDPGRYRRTIWIQRFALVALVFLLGEAGLVWRGVFGLLADRTDELFIAMTGSALCGAAIFVTGLSLLRRNQTAAKREALEAAITEFSQIDGWRAARCDAKFWTQLEAADFRREAAELVAGVFGTGQVTLTRPAGDYGVDMLACAAGGRIIAQCKTAREKIGAAEVRALAGAKTYFAADQAIMISREGPSAEAEEVNRMAERLEIAFWSADALANWAKRLRVGV